jgi:hypothetical protein
MRNGGRGRLLNSVVRCHLRKKLPPRELELYRFIDETLWRDWDPIGIGGMAGARDEYHGYLPAVYKLALVGDREKITDYLFSVATDQMGLTTQRSQHRAIADRILAEKARIGVGETNDT